eukprot:scaffold11579_cov40-Cyclotella_meneghiniana.AAC.5
MIVTSKSALKKGATTKSKRGKSVDTRKSSSGSESSGSKRKAPSSAGDDKGEEGDAKTAKFADSIPMNEGKTASTKKHAKTARKGKSYSEMTKTPEKTSYLLDDEGGKGPEYLRRSLQAPHRRVQDPPAVRPSGCHRRPYERKV